MSIKQIEDIFSQNDLLHRVYLKSKLEHQLKISPNIMVKKNKI